MDPQNPTPAPVPTAAPDLSYQVMPQDANHARPVSANPLPPLPNPIRASAAGVAAPTTNDSDLSMPLEMAEPWFNNKKILYIVGGVVVLVLLGLALYVLLGFNKKSTTTQPVPQQTTPVTKLPKVWLSQYFNSDTCTDRTVCGDDADSDVDGLSNYDEFKAGTSPILADTDADGLSDGDEAHVYKTDPILKYTDRRVIVQQNDWTDGFQVKNGYNPLTPGVKFTDASKQQILDDVKANPLHEPTLTTLSVNSDGSPNPINQTPAPTSTTNSKTVTVTFDNNLFNPLSVTINLGDTVVWLNKTTTTIHIRSTQPGLESPDLMAQQTFSYKFPAIGTFSYYDKTTPTIKGTVIVK